MKAEARFRPLRFPLGREQAQISSRPKAEFGRTSSSARKVAECGAGATVHQSTAPGAQLKVMTGPRLEAGELDHLPPLLCLFGDELTEFRRRTGRDLTSELGHARCHSRKAGPAPR